MHTFTQFDIPLASLWQSALVKEKIAYPFYTFSWHNTWFDHFGTNETLVIISHNDVIVPLSITDHVAHFTGGEEIADYLDAIGQENHKAETWKLALSALKAQGATSLLLRNIAEGATLDFFKQHKEAEVTEEDTTPTLTLPDSWDTYMTTLGRKERHEMRRKIRRFEESYQDLSFGPQAPVDIELLLTLMRKNEDKNQFLTPEMEGFFRDLPTAAGDTLTQFTLTKKDEPIATTLAFKNNTSLLLYNSGYAPEFEGSGWHLKAKLIEWAIVNHFTHLNFLQGGERYKYDLGAADVPVYRIGLTL